MRKFLVVFLVVAIALSSTLLISGCGCNKTGDNAGVSTSPKADIIGEWGGRSDDVEVSFNDDGTCSIGNVKGTYEIDDNDTITVKPLSDDKQSSSSSDGSMVFTYYSAEDGNLSNVPKDSWTISNGKLYINGYQYEKESDSSSDSSEVSDNSSSNSSSKSDNQSSNPHSSSSSSSSKPNSSKPINSVPSSSTPSSNPSSSTTSSKPSSSTPSSNPSSSTPSSKPNVVEVETIPTQPEEELEDPIFTIYENLDDFE